MKLTSAQQKEKEVWEYFMPKNVNWFLPTDKDIQMFFEWSEQGKHKDRQMVGDLSYFEALRQGKRWAGIHMHEMYEKGVLDGTMPYFDLLSKDTPGPVVDFMKKEMFKGADSSLIEKVFQMKLGKRESVIDK